MQEISEDPVTESQAEAVHMPAPTPWPNVLALMVAGMVTHWAVSLLGVILACRSSIGWFKDVFPHEKHINVPIETEYIVIKSDRTTRAVTPMSEENRKLLPIETFKLSSGLRGGIAGGIAMVVPATIFGLIRHHSVWYAANLLAAGGFVSWGAESDAFLAQFHLQGLLAALGIHSLTSILIGLLYGAMLPMFPHKPILTAGFVAPFLWTGILYSALGVISPILNARIDWLWFVISQIAFGLVCGFVVNLQEKVRTPQFRQLPFSVRAGLRSDQSREKGDDR